MSFQDDFSCVNKLACYPDVLAIKPDHLHMFIGARPTHKPCDIIKKIKGNTSIQLRRCFRYLQYLKFWQPKARDKSLWARGYYCGSISYVLSDKIQEYLLRHRNKDVFECTVYGDSTGQTKIGDFTRAELA